MKTYTIKAGKHYSNAGIIERIVPVISNSVAAIVEFNETAIYEASNEENQYDVNKLFGVVEGLNPHKNSCRFGWNSINGGILLYAYVYRNGEREIKHLCNVKKGKKYNCAIFSSDGKYEFFVKEVESNERIAEGTLTRAKNGRLCGFRLFPYWGGDDVAPHDFTVKIERL